MKSLFLPVLTRSATVVVVCTLLGTAAFAQAPATSAPGAPATSAEKPKPLASGDSTYVKNALKSLNYQNQLADAAKSLTNAYQKGMRDSTAEDLAAAREALSKIATAHGEKVADDVTGTDKADLDRVTKSKPDKLPKEWAAALAKESKHLDHETEIAGKTAQDAELKTFITSYGPRFRFIFTRADALDKELKKAK